MSSIDQPLSAIRPKMKDVIPQSFWISVLFAVFNMVTGYLTMSGDILYTVKLVTVIPIEVWGLAFFVLGFSMMAALTANNWKLSQSLHMAGIVIKCYWIAELVGSWIFGSSPFALVVWTLILLIQVVVFRHFDTRTGGVIAPRGGRE